MRLEKIERAVTKMEVTDGYMCSLRTIILH